MDYIRKNAVVLLTGTVNPNNMTFTLLSDPITRRDQYVNSIRFWINTVSIPVVFVENSNENLSPYFQRELEEGKLEILCFNGNDYDRNLGKGVGELNCLEYGYANSRFIKGADFVFKITGRYKVANFNQFLTDYYEQPKVNLLVDFKWNLSFCDSRFFGFSSSFIPGFLSGYKNLLDDSKGIFFEHVLSKATLTAIANGYVYRPLIALPRIEGYSASSNVRYNSNYFHWLRYKFEYTLKHRSFGLGNMPWI